MNLATPVFYIVANALPLYALSILDWEPVTVLWAYMAQSVVVVGYLLARTGRVLRASGVRLRVGKPVYTATIGRIAMHYAAAMAMCFLAVYLGVFGALLWHVAPLHSVGAWLAFSLSVVSFVISQQRTYRALRDGDRQARPHPLWLALPTLLRIAPIHASLILVLLRPDLQVVRYAALVVAAKIVADIAVDAVDRVFGLRAARLARTRSSATPSMARLP